MAKRMLFIIFLYVLVACQNAETPPRTLAGALPLDSSRPTFAYFYTDG